MQNVSHLPVIFCKSKCDKPIQSNTILQIVPRGTIALCSPPARNVPRGTIASRSPATVSSTEPGNLDLQVLNPSPGPATSADLIAIVNGTPPVPIVTPEDASRFLQQATFGAIDADIHHLSMIGASPDSVGIDRAPAATLRGQVAASTR